jgi:AraC-like DNA-binding protein
VDDSIEQAVKRAITTMRENLGEPLTVDDMARAAMFSKFHFTRVFQRTTGVSPGRFLSAMRLQRAKQLLVSTSLNVADISLRVGYNSVGTFSSRFSRSVGMPPTMYRRRAGFAARIPTDPDAANRQPSAARMYGRVWPSRTVPRELVFVGLFPERIPEGKPARCTVLAKPGPYQFENVPAGSWYVLAQSVTGDPEALANDDAPQTVSVATHGPVTVHGDTVVRADLLLKPAQALDPPVLLALLDARKVALAARAEQERRNAVPSIAPARPRVRTARSARLSAA